MKIASVSSVVASTLLPLSLACADTPPPSLLTSINVDTVSRYLVTSGVSALRSLVDVTFDDTSIDPYSGSFQITDIKIAVPYHLIDLRDCTLSASRISFDVSGIAELPTARSRISIENLDISPMCLPMEMRTPIVMSGIQKLAFPFTEIELEYDYGSSDPQITVQTSMEDVAAFSLDLKMSNLRYALGSFGNDVDLRVHLDSAHLAVQDKGLVKAVKKLAPPSLFDPNVLSMQFNGILSSEFSELDTDVKNTMEQSFKTAINEISKPNFQIAVQIGEKNHPQLDEKFFQDPSRALSKLAPEFYATEVAPTQVFDTAILRDSQSREMGLAFASGIGVPRNATRAEKILHPLAISGDGLAAFGLAQMFEHSGPQRAYQYALVAAKTREKGAMTLLTQLENQLDMKDALSAQQKQAAEPRNKLSLTEIRALARGHYSGLGHARNYEIAYFWALIGAAASDPACLSIQNDLDEKMAKRGVLELWVPIKTKIEQQAYDYWISQDLPTKWRSLNE
jgi:hypothetical protein